MLLVLIAVDYYAFGLSQYGRSYNGLAYRYGFNGKEKDENGEWGSQTVYDYGFRIYNPAIGKFLSVDPLTSSYPWYTPYQFAGNKPITSIDLDGLEEYEVYIYHYSDSERPFLFVTYNPDPSVESIGRPYVIHRYLEPTGDLLNPYWIGSETRGQAQSYEEYGIYNFDNVDRKIIQENIILKSSIEIATGIYGDRDFTLRGAEGAVGKLFSVPLISGGTDTQNGKTQGSLKFLDIENTTLISGSAGGNISLLNAGVDYQAKLDLSSGDLNLEAAPTITLYGLGENDGFLIKQFGETKGVGIIGYDINFEGGIDINFLRRLILKPVSITDLEAIDELDKNPMVAPRDNTRVNISEPIVEPLPKN